ncbi:Protein TolB [Pelotomaculum propionicicum]|uniref:Protein TolB n=2 Tax=Pelotomaculum propionicicum TaxID=258475 RepID=A0A4Y7RPI1_9FIRM|nr:Protein TolB [Pelotomaculum propionicicum]
MPKKIKTTVVPVSSMQQDNSSLPQVNVDAFRGQGRLAFVWNGLLYVLDGDNGTLTKLSDTGQARWPKYLPQRPDTVSLDPCWSPDGKHIAYVEAVEREDLADAGEVTSWQQARTLWVADADGKNARQVNEAGTGISRPLWSRDGSHIIYLKDNSIWLININGGSPVKIAGPLPDAPNSSGYYGYVSLLDILAFYGKQ